MEAVERIRDDNPMWGKTKIVVLLARQGIKTSASTIGRILKSLMDRGRVTPSQCSGAGQADVASG